MSQFWHFDESSNMGERLMLVLTFFFLPLPQTHNKYSHHYSLFTPSHDKISDKTVIAIAIKEEHILHLVLFFLNKKKKKICKKNTWLEVKAV